MELVDRFSYEEGENRSLYQLLVETLERLSRGDPVFTAVHFFELHLLDSGRLQAAVIQLCALQGRDPTAGPVLLGGTGWSGLSQMRNLVPDARPITMDALKYLRNFQRTAYTRLLQSVPSTLVEREVETILQYYNTFLLERRLNTPQFINEVRKNRVA